MNDRENILKLIQDVKNTFQKYKSMPQHREMIFADINNILKDMPSKIAAHLNYLMNLDIEAEYYLRKDYNPETMMLWERLKKDPNWHGYWVNACGLDVDLYCNYIIAGVKYNEDRNGRTLSKWFHDNYPFVKQIPQSIKLADEDFNIFFDK